MKIKLSKFWLCPSLIEATEAWLDIEDVGLQSIKTPLPQIIVDQIEGFYRNEYCKRMEQALAKPSEGL